MTKEEAIMFLRKCDREETCHDFQHGHCKGCNIRTALDMGIEALQNVPIKCCECRHSTPIVSGWYCNYWIAEVRSDDFCSMAYEPFIIRR